jgi:hypothetical protein
MKLFVSLSIFVTILLSGFFWFSADIYADEDASGETLTEVSTGTKIYPKRWSMSGSFLSGGIFNNETIEEWLDVPTDKVNTKKIINNSIIRLCRNQADTDHKKLEASFRKIYDNDDDILEAFKSVRRTYLLHKKKNEVISDDESIYSQNTKEILTTCMNYRIESIDKKIEANQN